MFANYFFRLFRRFSKPRVFGISLLLLLVIGWLDYLTGYFLFFDVFYLIPVSLCAWFVNRNIGFIFAVICAITVFVANLSATENPGVLSVELWNLAAHLAFFMIFAQVSNLLGTKLEDETRLARTDFLTGASNARAFYDQAEMEISRSRRSHQPLSIAYIDLDNFKKVNDTRGHTEGDKVLKEVVSTLKQSLRASDLVARLGGDEFAILLPETDFVQSKVLAQRLRQAILKISEHYGWPITISMGVLTCPDAPPGLQSVIEKADALMYKVKASGKNAVLHSNFQIDG
jgi:diguanylate cyclase (GGDEF)-like protein